MAGKSLITTVTLCETIVGRTVFQIAEETDSAFSKVIIDQNTVLQLQPVHYKYIDPTVKHPRKFAIIGEYDLTGKQVTLAA